MTSLTCLADLLSLHPAEIPRREQRAWLDGVDPVVLQCCLTRVAVIRRLPDIGYRELVLLNRVYVEEETLAWEGELDAQRRRSAARGRGMARRNRRSLVCRSCGKERDGDDLARITGSLCQPCKTEQARQRRANRRAESHGETRNPLPATP